MMASHGCDLYSSCPLDTTRSIRLVRILNPSEEIAPLACTLESFNVGQTPPYTALSYTWGSATQNDSCDSFDEESTSLLNQHLDVNGCVLKITSNLKDALFTLRKLHQDQYFWIDAICINQADKKERASQIPLMGTIFRTAGEVLAWLGNAGDADVADVAWFHSVLLPAIRAKFGREYLRSPDSPALTRSTLKEMKMDDLPAHTDGFNDLYQRQWFARIWVAQEVALAKSIRLLYGTCFLEFNDTCDLHGLWLRCDTDIYFRVESINHHPFEVYLGVMNFLRRFVLDGGFTDTTGEFAHLDPEPKACVDMIRLANLLRPWHCTDPRDRFYALYGILESVYQSWNKMDSRLPIDYSMEVEHLYLHAITLVASRTFSLDFLSEVEDPSQRQRLGLPSWIPDFTVKMGKKHIPIYRHQQAGGACTFGKTFCIQRSHLLVTSIAVGMVEQISNLTIHNGQKSEILPGAISSLSSFCLSMPPMYHTGESRLKALCQTIIADSAQESKQSSVAFLRKFSRFLYICDVAGMHLKFNEYLEERIDRSTASKDLVTNMLSYAAATYCTWRSVLDMLAQELVGEPSNTSHRDQHIMFPLLAGLQSLTNRTLIHKMLEEMDRISRQIDEKVVYMAGRCLLRLHTGNIGLGPVSTQIGDQVHILHDCSMPMVLRPCGTYSDHKGKVLQAYRVIGEVYVHGLMHQESHDKAFCDSFSELALV